MMNAFRNSNIIFILVFFMHNKKKLTVVVFFWSSFTKVAFMKCYNRTPYTDILYLKTLWYSKNSLFCPCEMRGLFSA